MTGVVTAAVVPVGVVTVTAGVAAVIAVIGVPTVTVVAATVTDTAGMDTAGTDGAGTRSVECDSDATTSTVDPRTDAGVAAPPGACFCTGAALTLVSPEALKWRPALKS